MRRARASITLAACLVCGSAVNAQAAPGRFELSWLAPETCPSGALIEHRVERILNRPLSVRDDDVLVVRAVVNQPARDQPWRVELETDNGQRHSSRSLEAASCDELAGATALLVAILLEPNVEHAVPLGAMPTKPTPANPSPAPASAPPLRAGPARGTPVRFALGAFGGAVSGLLPAWSFGLGLDGGVEWKALRWSLSGAYFRPVEQSAPDSGGDLGQGARFQLVSAATKLCLVQPIQRVSGGICSGVELALLHARGIGPGVHSNAQQAKFMSVSAGARLGWAASSRLAFLLEADALLPLGSRQFVFDGSAPAQIHTPHAGVQLALGAQFLFGKTENGASGPTTSFR